LDFKDPAALDDIVPAQSPLLAINVLGLPSAALPTHLDGTTPLGVQLVGPMHGDGFVLDVAERMERELGTLWQHLAERNT
jgi:amidase